VRAKAGLKIKREVAESAFLQGTNRFTVVVRLRDRRTLEVSTEKLAEGLGGAGATYVAPYRQPRGSNEIKATIGGLGLIDVRFVPESEEEAPPALTECQGGKTVIEEGKFVGQISFRGECGYTRVRAITPSGRSPRAQSGPAT
jgi:hypothetical protein